MTSIVTMAAEVQTKARACLRPRLEYVDIRMLELSPLFWLGLGQAEPDVASSSAQTEAQTRQLAKPSSPTDCDDQTLLWPSFVVGTGVVLTEAPEVASVAAEVQTEVPCKRCPARIEG